MEAYSSTQVIPARDTLDITGFEEETKGPVVSTPQSLKDEAKVLREKS